MLGGLGDPIPMLPIWTKPRDINKDVQAWVRALEHDDADGAIHELWLTISPWLKQARTTARLDRLNSDDMEPWIPVWLVFGTMLPQPKINEWELEYPWLKLWLHFHEKNYQYEHYVDQMVHAAFHQNLQAFSNGLLARTDQRLLTDALPPWAAVYMLRTMVTHPELADSHPNAVMALVDFTRLLANPGNKAERRRSSRFFDLLNNTPELAPIRAYAQANRDLTVPYHGESELALARLFPASLFISAIRDRDCTPADHARHVEQWPQYVKEAYLCNLALGEEPVAAIHQAWTAYRVCGNSTTLDKDLYALPQMT